MTAPNLNAPHWTAWTWPDVLVWLDKQPPSACRTRAQALANICVDLGNARRYLSVSAQWDEDFEDAQILIDMANRKVRAKLQTELQTLDAERTN